MYNDRRKYTRFNCDEVIADYRLLNPVLWAAFRARGRKYLRDISLGGLSFIADEQLPLRSIVHIKFRLDTMAHFSEMCGRIVRVRMLSPQRHEIGVRFFWWSNEEDKVLLLKHFDQV